VINTHHLAPAMERGARAIASELGLSLEVSREEKQILAPAAGVRATAAGDASARVRFFLLNG